MIYPSQANYKIMGLGSLIRGVLPHNNKNLLAVISSKFVSAHGYSIHDILWQPFVLSMGGNVFLIGILRFLWDITSSWFQRLGGRMSDYAGRKITLLIASLIVMASIMLYIESQTWEFRLFGNITLPGLILLFPAMALFALGFSFSEPAAQAIVAESVGTYDRGKGYALFFTMLFLPTIYMSVLAGAVVDIFGFSFMWTTMLLLEAASLIIAINLVNETLAGKIRPGFRALFAPLKNWVRIPRKLKVFGMAVVFDKIGWNLWIGVMFGMLIQTYHLALLEIGILNAVLFGTMVLLQIPIGRLIDRGGEKMFLVLSEAFLLFALFTFVTSNGFAGFAIAYFFVGVAGALWLPAYGIYVTKHTASVERGKIFGDLNAKRGIIASPAPLVGSILFTILGFNAPLLMGMFSIGIALVLLAVMKS